MRESFTVGRSLYQQEDLSLKLSPIKIQNKVLPMLNHIIIICSRNRNTLVHQSN